MTKTTAGTQWQHALIVLTVTVVSVVAIAVLYWAQSIFIPVALAAFLTFLLSPLVSALHQRGVGRTPAVFVTVCAAALFLGMVGWVVTSQVTGLLVELPRYSQNIKDKAKALKKVAASSNGLTKMVVDINRELVAQPGGEEATKQAKRDATESTGDGPAKIYVEPRSPVWLSRISSLLAPILEYLGELALAMVLVIFMLQKREELRNRLIRLVGQGQIVAATRFVDEAGQRISRFLLMQAIVNSTFGLILGLGLLFMGVKYALLWGFLAAMLRYLPYIGPYVAALFPITISLAMFDGWGTALCVAVLFITLELIVANGVEPWLYGKSMGVSEIALLVSAAFWAFLWGPIGLVLSSPLTVCLVMLGRYVPQLEFLAVLLGDEPALDPSMSFFQRLLARDQGEAEDLVLEHLKTEAPEGIYDAMLIPTLSAARRSRGRGDITEADEQYIWQAIREIVEDLSERHTAAGVATTQVDEADSSASTQRTPAIQIFGCPAHDKADQVALEMLENLLDPTRWDLAVIAPETLTAELLDQVAQQQPPLVCLAATAPGGLAHARYLCKRLRGRFPDLKILVWRCGSQPHTQSSPGPLLEAGADSVTTTLVETRQLLTSLLPVLVYIERERANTALVGGVPAVRNDRALSRSRTRQSTSTK